MPKTLPVALILFSNDMDSFLPSVEKERKIIEEAFEHLDVSNRIKIITRSSVSIEEVFRLFNRYKGRIALFHFAGHADGDGLQFNKAFTDTDHGNAVGLADLFKQEVVEGILKMVFLNGCSTHPQEEMLKKAGISTIISTKHPIQDSKALAFSKQFYRCFANSERENPFENMPAVQEAFERATAYLKTAYSVNADQTERGFKVEAEDGEGIWLLHTSEPTWKLDFKISEESKVYNEWLTLHLMQAIQSHSTSARKFASKVAENKIEEWETIGRVADKAREIIAYGFVGVLGIQLQKLFAIGKNPPSKEKEHQYLRNCLLTCKRALQLVCFAMLSFLWDKQKEKAISFSQEEKKGLEGFFDNQFDLDINGYVGLLKILYGIFLQQKIDFPMEEIKELEEALKPDSPFTSTCEKLNQLNRKLDKQEVQQADCFLAEKQLTSILQTLHFLAAYRMVSMKQISYDEMRNSPPKYLHSFAALGIDSKLNVNAERVNYVDAPINTDAVLLYKGRYQQSINLFPFIIDLNALSFENGAKVCFYHSQDFNDGSLHYSFLEDNSLENIVYQGIQKSNPDFNELMMDLEKRKIHKLDIVWQQFQEAKKALLGDVSMDDWGEEDDGFEF